MWPPLLWNSSTHLVQLRPSPGECDPTTNPGARNPQQGDPGRPSPAEPASASPATFSQVTVPNNPENLHLIHGLTPMRWSSHSHNRVEDPHCLASLPLGCQISETEYDAGLGQLEKHLREPMHKPRQTAQETRAEPGVKLWSNPEPHVHPEGQCP